MAGREVGLVACGVTHGGEGGQVTLPAVQVTHGLEVLAAEEEKKGS